MPHKKLECLAHERANKGPNERVRAHSEGSFFWVWFLLGAAERASNAEQADIISVLWGFFSHELRLAARWRRANV